MKVKIDEIFTSNKYRLFINYCNEKNIVTIDDLSRLDFKEIERINGIGIRKFNDIVNCYNNYIAVNHIDLTLHNYEHNQTFLNGSYDNIDLSEIEEEILNQNINLLVCIGFTNREIKKLEHLGFKTIKEVFEKYNKIDNKINKKIENKLSYFKQPLYYLCKLLMRKLMAEKGADFFSDRAYGFTLREIGDNKGITRERVRQVVERFEIKAAMIGKLIISRLMNDKKTKIIKAEEISKIIEDKEQLYCILYSLKRSEEVQYINFIDAYGIGIDLKVLYSTLDNIEQEIISGFVNYYDRLEIVEDMLNSNNIDYIEADNCIEYFIQKGYNLDGDYIIKNNISYAIPAVEMVKIHFPNGIKLYEKESLDKLRSIIHSTYSRIKLPKKDRAFIARISEHLVLSDRGEYIHKDNTYIDMALLAEIHDYINNSQNEVIMYHEIYEQYKGKLNIFSSISNRHYLHGILKYYYHDDFVYERDVLRKTKGSNISIGDRIANYIFECKGAIDAKIIRKKFSGITNAILINAVMTTDKLIQWEYCKYNNIDNLKITNDNVVTIKKNMLLIFEEFNGYCSDYLLYQACEKNMKEFIEINKIRNSMNLYYIAMYFFDKSYIFRRPHIATKNFSNNDIDMKEIVKTIVFNNNIIRYSNFIKVGDKLGWSKATMYNVFREFESTLFRISEDEYVFTQNVQIKNNIIESLKNMLYDEINSCGFSTLFGLIDFECLPSFEWEWNGYLVESIIKHYDLNLKILYPNNTDRRYLRGIIVFKDSSYINYVEFIKAMLGQDIYQGISEERLEFLIQIKGLASGKISKELINMIKIA